jgi:hypothetical protein
VTASGMLLQRRRYSADRKRHRTEQPRVSAMALRRTLNCPVWLRSQMASR